MRCWTRKDGASLKNTSNGNGIQEEYRTVRGPGEARYEDRRSLFIGQVSPVTREEEALAFIAGVRRQYPDANHHVYAYILRENAIMRYTDDREPSGTAGMPVLDSLRKRGLTDVCAVVTRYFGGTLLGTGGLVRAYTEAASRAIEAAEIVTRAMRSFLRFTVGYADYPRILPVLAAADFRTESSEFREAVTVFGSVRREGEEALLLALREATGARCQAEKTEEKFAL